MQEPIEISQDNDVSEQLTFHNSANFLCNFMREQAFLLDCLKRMALRPRYFEERIDYLGLPEYPTLTFPMLCFCDIPLSKVGAHMEEYGKYGLALNKNYCIGKDVQPITYLNKNARLKEDIAFVLKKLLEQPPIEEQWHCLPDLFLSQLMYIKPIDGDMRRGDEQLKHLIFKDECEWRYIPKTPSDLPLILPPKENTEKGRQVFSDALGEDRSTWFTFGIEHIEYIIVPSEADAVAVISAISNMKKKPLKDKHRLISKIEIAKKFDRNLV